MRRVGMTEGKTMKYLIANWKMYLDYQQSLALADALADVSFDSSKLTAVICPNALAFSDVRDRLNGSAFFLGAQNVNWAPLGAYTGATSAHLFKQAGAAYALVGHSERRYIFGETNESVRKKLEASIDAGLVPVLCIGETAEDREAGKREYRLKKEILSAFDGLSLPNEESVLIAYEPVWAISQGGDGTACTPADADDVHGWIRQELKQYTDKAVPILYGGSVTPDNVADFCACEMVDGVLAGHASTKFDSLTAMIRAIEGLS